MNDRQYNELELWAGQQLHAVPVLRAPPELATRVGNAISDQYSSTVQKQPHPYSAAWRIVLLATCLASLATFALLRWDSTASAQLTAALIGKSTALVALLHALAITADGVLFFIRAL